ncbi:MAG: type II toxin-antitoxin system RelE/ParE family toxin [Reyranellaceae bacterium]
MAQIVYARNALTNLERLYRFLATNNPRAATRAMQATSDRLELLESRPRLGPVDSEQPDLREFSIPFGSAGYLARYRLDGDLIIVLAVRHAREAGYTVDP